MTPPQSPPIHGAAPSTSARLPQGVAALVTPDLLPQFDHHNLAAIQMLATASPLSLQADQFVFLRHGQTAGNFRRIFQNADIPLNDHGLAQAERAARALQGSGIDRIFASDMQRAWQTAQAAARAVGLEPLGEPGLRERWFGDLIGTSSVDLDWGFDPPNGEPLADFVARVRETARARIDAAPDRTTLLVAHGGVLYALAFALQALIRPEYIENATPLRFERIAGQWTITPLMISDVRLGASGV